MQFLKLTGKHWYSYKRKIVDGLKISNAQFSKKNGRMTIELNYKDILGIEGKLLAESKNGFDFLGKWSDTNEDCGEAKFKYAKNKRGHLFMGNWYWKTKTVEGYWDIIIHK